MFEHGQLNLWVVYFRLLISFLWSMSSKRKRSMTEEVLEESNPDPDKHDLASEPSYMMVQSGFIICLHCKQTSWHQHIIYQHEQKWKTCCEVRKVCSAYQCWYFSASQIVKCHKANTSYATAITLCYYKVWLFSKRALAMRPDLVKQPEHNAAGSKPCWLGGQVNLIRVRGERVISVTDIPVIWAAVLFYQYCHHHYLHQYTYHT